MLETLASHVADRMKGLRAAQLQREAAVAEERQFIAAELHHSIAQSLAFLKIQAGLLRAALRDRDDGRIETGLKELESGIQDAWGVHAFGTRCRQAGHPRRPAAAPCRAPGRRSGRAALDPGQPARTARA
jgi:signal transduction histidine kinase